MGLLHAARENSQGCLPTRMKIVGSQTRHGSIEVASMNSNENLFRSTKIFSNLFRCIQIMIAFSGCGHEISLSCFVRVEWCLAMSVQEVGIDVVLIAAELRRWLQ